MKLSLFTLLWTGWTVAALAQAPPLQLVSVSPRHIFTPTVPGHNVFSVTIDNPSDSAVTAAHIYDVTGAHVADMVLSSTNPDYVLQWNGRGYGGGFVHAGIYIYKIVIASHVFSGSVVVAR